MKIGFFTQPVHPLDKPWKQCLAEDQEAFILADELGYSEAYAGEHVTDVAENITSNIVFLATLAGRTKHIKLGLGTLNMPNIHPAAAASQISMLDHLLDGRLILGISPGGLLSDAEVFGNLDQNRNEMFLEAINQVIEIWTTDAPYDIRGKYWNISTKRTYLPEIGQGIIGKPLQRPHPPIIVTAVAPFSKGVTEAAIRGWDPLSANFLHPVWVKSHWPQYVEGCKRGGRPVDPANWRIGRSIFVNEDEKVAREYATGPESPYRQYYHSVFTKLKANGRLEIFKTHLEQPDSEVTVDALCEKLVIWGTPAQVTEKLLAFREDVGDFGQLIYAGKDWLDRDLGRKSMILMAEKVLPAINAAISGEARRPAAAE
ncbi:alkanesulfonate monooxygenase SsuD/methylene tetrahydromethanopterin reductase-like flavin-dependent oxidoreductase (luciferase family) [Nitrobacteraceae bacterium AZCC 2161]